MLVDGEASAMLDGEDGAKQADCKHCQGGESSDQPQQRYWDIPLDADLLETIVNIYPDWFKDDDAKNKEALKVKLMLRRPNKRTDQGILQPLKSPPAFHEQIQKLERSNMGDILKNKFQKKQDRQEFAQNHILDDLASGAEKKLSKKARLSDAADHLTKGLAEELLLTQAVHDGAAKGLRPEEADSGSDAAFSPSPPPYDFSEHSQSSVPSLEALSPVSPASSPACLPPSSLDHVPADFLVLHHPPCGAGKSRKKAKPKPQQPKAKQMKFHEYKGPPSAQKPPLAASGNEQSSCAELNAQQQQLLIQLQMECDAALQRPPEQPVQTILQKPAAPAVPAAAAAQPSQQQLFDAPTSPQKLLLSNFEDLKVTDLKAELKKKGLPVSGSKPQLIQRLRSHVPQLQQEGEEGDLEEEIANDHIVQLQQIWIETLTREVERSREQLRECQLPAPAPSKTAGGGENKKQIIQQLLQQKIQQQELQKRLQSAVPAPSSTPSTLTALLESGPLNPPPLDLPKEEEEVVDFGGLDTSSPEDFPGVMPIFICAPDTPLEKEQPLTPSRSLPSFAVIRPSTPDPRRQPPDYSEATRQLKVKQQQLLRSDDNPRQSKKLKPSSVKSQAVDDVLDILISSGELSPSAAQEPLLAPFFPSAPKEVPPPSSLQSVLDLTPPPSTGFSGAVDFDFPLDLDLDGLDSLPLKKPPEPLRQGVDDRGLIEWLEEYEESSVATAFQPSSAPYGDPLLLNGHEALDFFSASDDLDFKPPASDFSAFMPSWTT